MTATAHDSGITTTVMRQPVLFCVQPGDRSMCVLQPGTSVVPVGVQAALDNIRAGIEQI